MYDELYMEAILNPEKIEDSVENMVSRIKEDVREARSTGSVLGATEDLDPGDAQRFLTHPLPHWVERMTTSYVESRGGRAQRQGAAWRLEWPDGAVTESAVFSGKDLVEHPTAVHLTTEQPRIRGLASHLPRFVPGQPISSMSLCGVAAEVRGYWSLWRIDARGPEWAERRILPLFVHDDGRVLGPTARNIWDQLLSAVPGFGVAMRGSDAIAAYEQVREKAEEQGKGLYRDVLLALKQRVQREEERGSYAFAARRRAIERVGLPEVRNFRLMRLDEEERQWREGLSLKTHVIPELVPIVLMRVVGGGSDV
jgi:hypothetical protein